MLFVFQTLETESSPANYSPRYVLSRVLTNLVANSISHTEAGGSITLESEISKQTLTLSVIDTGSGIPIKELPYIFDRFYRADKARTSSQNRSGLGLAICQSSSMPTTDK